jgi:hypothetical protein
LRIGIAIKKSVSFRGVEQEFSNVYHYELLGALTGPYESLMNEVVENERFLHSSDVSFRTGQVWSAGGTKEENVMVFQAGLTGVGNQDPQLSQDRERAVLVRWRAGLDSRNKPVYLRKWFHACGRIANVQLWAAGVLQNTVKISPADRDTIESAASAFNEIGITEAWQFCSASGRRIEGMPDCHDYLEHHQLGDMWR